MARKRIGTIVGVVALALIAGGITRGCVAAPAPDAMVTSASSSVLIPEVGQASVDSTLEPTATVVPAPSKRSGPTAFLMPDFTDYDENDVESWLDAHDVSVTTTFDYGEAEGSDCAEAGDGVVEAQSPKAGTKLSNKLSTHLVFDAYCDY